MEPLYSSEVTTPGCRVLIGGGGISEAEDAKAAAGESLACPAGTGMAPARLAGHGSRLIAVRAMVSVGVYGEGGRGPGGPPTFETPSIPPQFSLPGAKLPEKYVDFEQQNARFPLADRVHLAYKPLADWRGLRKALWGIYFCSSLLWCYGTWRHLLKLHFPATRTVCDAIFQTQKVTRIAGAALLKPSEKMRTS